MEAEKAQVQAHLPHIPRIPVHRPTIPSIRKPKPIFNEILEQAALGNQGLAARIAAWRLERVHKSPQPGTLFTMRHLEAGLSEAAGKGFKVESARKILSSASTPEEALARILSSRDVPDGVKDILARRTVGLSYALYRVLDDGSKRIHGKPLVDVVREAVEGAGGGYAGWVEAQARIMQIVERDPGARQAMQSIYYKVLARLEGVSMVLDGVRQIASMSALMALSMAAALPGGGHLHGMAGMVHGAMMLYSMSTMMGRGAARAVM